MSRSWSVGYKRPPVRSRFRKGISGNPKGRPKRSRNVLDAILRHLDRPITITINGRRRTMSIFDAILMQLSNKALSGDLKAMKAVSDLRLMAEEWREENIEKGPQIIVLSGDDAKL
ncbi:MAG: hypothetical protein J0H44_17240 [Alphaproteobacteria bacterium]|nr:hypothetical protein [Alphaproteobacteria bacterium]